MQTLRPGTSPCAMYGHRNSDLCFSGEIHRCSPPIVGSETVDAETSRRDDDCHLDNLFGDQPALLFHDERATVWRAGILCS